MEEQLSPLAVTHLLQHTLRSLCIHPNSQWVYAVFWRILPRNYPPPKWDGQGAFDRSRGNRRNWILGWEDGFCNFAASSVGLEMNNSYGKSGYGEFQGLQPELFFKMSHEIYNYGEGLIGKVAGDQSHKWIHNEPNDEDINFLPSWHHSVDSYPRTWEAQFQSGIKTIALIAVREGVVQLGAVHKVIEDLSYVVVLRKRFSYIESIPGVLLPHPSSSSFPPDAAWRNYPAAGVSPPPEFYEHLNHQLQYKITPSMSSLEALLSKLPSVVPPSRPIFCESQYLCNNQRPNHVEIIAKQEIDSENYDSNNDNIGEEPDLGESSTSISAAYGRQQFQQQHVI